ncbi:MAG: sigma-70 family RNA polymerase sigma factor [Planctomycetota bacterium]
MTEEFVSAGDGSTSLSLLQRARQNDSAAWDKLVELYAPIIYMRCRNRWGYSSADALQIGQEVFLKVAGHLDDFDRQRTGSFRKWLRTIVDNKCKDDLRKKQVAIASGGTKARQVLEQAADEASLEEQKEHEFEANEKAVLMSRAAKLVEAQTSSRDWKIFWRVNVDNSNRQVVAEEFGVSDNVVYLACSRIKKLLKATFQDLLDDDLFDAMTSTNN